MRLTSSTWSGRIFLLLIACVCLGTLGYPGAGLAREEYTSDTRGGEGDPGDGHDFSGGGLGDFLNPVEEIASVDTAEQGSSNMVENIFIWEGRIFLIYVKTFGREFEITLEMIGGHK